MKKILGFAFLLISTACFAQQQTQNIIIITTDGFRWQEVFKGMDTAIANRSEWNEGDSSYIFEKYWHPDPQERRKKLMPFLWSTIAKKGQVFGNRDLDCRMDNANPYWFSNGAIDSEFLSVGRSAGYPIGSIIKCC